MAIDEPSVTIIGCGPGGADYITPAAGQAAAAADVLVGSQRLLDLFPQCPGRRIPYRAEEAVLDEVDACLQAGQRVAVLVSGDSGLFSAASHFIRRFGRGRCRVIPGISSVQVAFARMGVDWADAKILSAHGRLPIESNAELAACEKIAILAGTGAALDWAGRLAGSLSASHEVYVCERLTLSGERVRRLEPGEVAACGASSLCIILILSRSVLA